MATFNNIRYEQEITKLNKYIKDNLNKIEFLKEVHLSLTKDGKEFQHLTKAFKFDNNKFEGEVCKEDDYYVLRGYNKETKEFTPRISIYDYIQLDYDYSKNCYPTPEGVDETRIIRGTWRVPYYLKNTKELEESIQKQIQGAKENIEQEKRKLEVLPKLKKLTEKYLKDMEAIEEEGMYLSYLARELF